MPDPANESTNHALRWARLALPVLIFAACFAAFLPALDNGLVDFDDQALLVEQIGYRGLEPENITWMFRTTTLGHWQPLTWLSYAIDYQIAGRPADPERAAAIFHFTSMVLHAANAALLYFIAARLVRAAGLREGVPLRIAAGAAALLWGVHPLRVESVAWATERRDVLSGCFLLLAVLAYLRAFPRGALRPASIASYLASIALLALSLLAKPWGMSFFIIATILDWYPLRRLPDHPFAWLRAPSRVVLLQKLPYAVLGLASARMATWAIHSINAMRPVQEWPFSARIAQAFYGLVWYPLKSLWPESLSPLYELRHGLNPLGMPYLACYLAVIAVGLLVFFLRRRIPAITASLAAYAIIIAPVLGFTQSGDQFVADRYSYLATISLYLAAAGGLLIRANRAGRPARIGLGAAAGVAIVLFVWATRRQATLWRDPITLWTAATENNPGLMMPHINLANNLAKAGDTDGALAHYRTAAEVRPRDGRPWALLGDALRKRGDAAGAEAAYRTSALYIPQAYIPLVQLGNLLRHQPGREDEALESYRAAVDAVEHPRPGSVYSAGPFLSLASYLKVRGRIDEARSLFLRVLNDPKARPEEREQARAHLAELGASGQK